ncbi:MAG: biopolymer transporter ExbD, partial [Phycisphaerales bacterium JB038]
MAEPSQAKLMQDTPVAHRSSRARRREQRASIGLNLTAMIDVVFLLLLYFLLATSFALNEEAFELELPDPVAGQAADRSEEHT